LKKRYPDPIEKVMPDVREATAKEIVRLSELYLDGTLRLSLGADARAMQLSGILGALERDDFRFGHILSWRSSWRILRR
jgi:hypothetical protein